MFGKSFYFLVYKHLTQYLVTCKYFMFEVSPLLFSSFANATVLCLVCSTLFLHSSLLESFASSLLFPLLLHFPKRHLSIFFHGITLFSIPLASIIQLLYTPLLSCMVSTHHQLAGVIRSLFSINVYKAHNIFSVYFFVTLQVSFISNVSLSYVLTDVLRHYDCDNYTTCAHTHTHCVMSLNLFLETNSVLSRCCSSSKQLMYS